jgi:hypothetical protein
MGTVFVASAAPAQDKDPMVLHEDENLVVRAHFQAGLNLVAEKNISATLTPSEKFDPDTEWVEAYVMPGVSFTRQLRDNLVAYGKVSAIASGTVGTDAFRAGNTGRVTIEEGYLGLRSADTVETPGTAFDISLGPRTFVAGTGMLISNGGSSGFKRGALKLGPHRAWEMAAIAKVSRDRFSATAFYVDANESPDSDGHNAILGGDLRYDGAAGHFVGVTFGNVVNSTSPYPKAAPNGIGVPSILPDAREGLNFVSLYGRTNPLGGKLGNFFIAGDFAYEWNDRINLRAWAGRIQLGYSFASHPWSPTITYAYQTFSGDDPSTARIERFDPLYYEGSPSAWSTGSKSAMVFINSNVNAHQFSFRVTPTKQDIITLRYAHIRANELLSPIQFGQATRVEEVDGILNPIAGVTNAHLSDDIFIEFNRAVNANTYLTAGLSVSFPGVGIDGIARRNAPYWSGGFVNVVVNF